MTYNTEKTAEIRRLFTASPEKTFSAAEILKEICPDGKGESTVYRIIAKLTDEGYIKKITDGKSRHVYYQYLGSHECALHLHLKCKECGMLIHLDEQTSHDLEENLLATEGFMLDGGAMLFGKCKGCRNAGEVLK